MVDLVCVLSRILGLFVESSDFGDDAVDSSGHLCRGFSGSLAGRAAVVPDAPVRSLLLDILGKHSLVRSIVPFSNIRVGDKVAFWGRVSAKEKFGGSLSSSTWGDEDVSEMSRVDELSRANHSRAHFEDHFLTVGGKRNVSDAGMSTVQGPLSLAVADEVDSGHSFCRHLGSLEALV